MCIHNNNLKYFELLNVWKIEKEESQTVKESRVWYQMKFVYKIFVTILNMSRIWMKWLTWWKISLHKVFQWVFCTYHSFTILIYWIFCCLNQNLWLNFFIIMLKRLIWKFCQGQNDHPLDFPNNIFQLVWQFNLTFSTSFVLLFCYPNTNEGIPLTKHLLWYFKNMLNAATQNFKKN